MPTHRRRTIAYALLLVAGIGVFVTVKGAIDQRALVRERSDFKGWMSAGRFTDYEPADRETPAAALPWGRRLFGDRPVKKIELPFGWDERVPRLAAKLFPEASTIAIEPGARAVARQFGGDAGVVAVSHPERVQMCRLKPSSVDSRSVADYQLEGDCVSISSEASALVAAKLIEPTSYDWHASRTCLPEYRLRITFERSEESVDVVVCWHCSALLIFRDSQKVSAAYFGNELRNTLLTATQQAFPDDAAIAELELRPTDSSASPAVTP